MTNSSVDRLVGPGVRRAWPTEKIVFVFFKDLLAEGLGIHSRT